MFIFNILNLMRNFILGMLLLILFFISLLLVKINLLFFIKELFLLRR